MPLKTPASGEKASRARKQTKNALNAIAESKPRAPTIVILITTIAPNASRSPRRKRTRTRPTRRSRLVWRSKRTSSRRNRRRALASRRSTWSSALPGQRKPPPARKTQIIARNKVLATKPKGPAKRQPATSHSLAATTQVVKMKQQKIKTKAPTSAGTQKPQLDPEMAKVLAECSAMKRKIRKY